ncbi:MAG: hypothetical protein GX094_11645 [Clostridiales bacterium]|nr:hypothetical protein [Alcaligenaceae bacterium]NLO83686.1 hypothetical protein [Clostridiales bacterium]
MIRDIYAIDSKFDGRSLILHHCNGDCYSENGYMLQETALNEGDMIQFVTNGGRPCDGAFPYFHLLFDGCGMNIAIGWPAQWWASFVGIEEGVCIKAGQEKTNIKLMPGESIRTPSMGREY